MMCNMVKRKNRGFTLIEMLIVIVVIAVLALIVIPKLLGAGRKQREAVLRENLQQLRQAISKFEEDTSAWPPALSDIMAANGDALSADADGNGTLVDRTLYRGPYLSTADGKLLPDPFTNAADWNYSNTTGEVHSSSTMTALDGSKYSEW